MLHARLQTIRDATEEEAEAMKMRRRRQTGGGGSHRPGLELRKTFGSATHSSTCLVRRGVGVGGRDEWGIH